MRLPPTLSISVPVSADDRIPKERDLWHCLPDGAFAQLYDAKKKGTSEQSPIPGSGGEVTHRGAPGRARLDINFRRFSVSGASTEWLKIFVNDAGSVTGIPHARAGVLVGDVLKHADRVVVVPGFSQRPNGHLGRLPQLTVDFRGSLQREAIGRQQVHYGFHGIWGMGLRELLSYLAEIDSGRLYVSDEAPSEYAEGMLVNALGLEGSPRWTSYDPTAETRRKGKFLLRGQIVAIRFSRKDPDAWVPCIVVSCNAYNAQDASWVIVLQCIPRKADDDTTDELTVPLPDKIGATIGVPALDKKHWVARLTLLRGIRVQTDFVYPAETPFVYEADGGVWKRIESGLERLYGNGTRS